MATLAMGDFSLRMSLEAFEFYNDLRLDGVPHANAMLLIIAKFNLTLFNRR